MKRLIAAAVAVVALALSSVATPAPARAATGVKVVIVVGAMGNSTLYATYRAAGDSAYAAFSRYTPNVVKVYSPGATWSAVSAAAQGANVLVYIGHGSGWPNPYTATHQPSTNNGMGLNLPGATSDNQRTYYGEDNMAQLGLAPNAVVLLWKACYTAGNSEDGKTAPTLAVAKQRVDGYASGFIRAGASAVVAEPHGDVAPYAAALFTSDGARTIDDIWKHAPNFHNNVFSWASTHKDADGIDDYAGRGSVSQEDPDVPNPTGGNVFWRSMVGAPSTTVSQILGGAMNPNVSRWSGADRYEAAAKISANTFKTTPVPVAFIALGTGFPDALTGAAAAAKLGGPILLTTSTYIPAATDTELKRLKPAKIYLLGGTASISSGVETSLHAYATSVERLAGADRYDVARNVALKFFSPGVSTAFVALGEKFPDALSGAAVAGRVGAPVLLLSSTGIPAPTADALSKLKPAKIVILGGPASVSTTTETALGQFGAPVERWSDADRYSTAVAVSKNVFKTPGVPYAFVATGANFPDALAGAAIAARWGGPVLLVQTTAIPSSVVAELQRLQPQKIVVLGGPASVSGSVLWQLTSFVPSA